MASFRVDIGSLRPPQLLPGGKLRVDAAITRTGVFTYHRADGSTIREYRPPSEVFSQGTLDSFRNAYVTNNHPNVMVDPTNAKEFTVGIVDGVPTQDDTHMIVPMILWDADAIADARAGKDQVSGGYWADIEVNPGTSPEGEKYDTIQRKIRGNHVAIVRKGRAGSTVRMRLDAADDVAICESLRFDAAPPKGKMTMELAEALMKLGEATAALTTQTTRADKAETERDEHRARADQAERDLQTEKTARTDAASNRDSEIDARVTLQSTASVVLDEKDKPFSFVGKSDRDVHLACVKKLDGRDLKDEDDVYVRATFDALMKRSAEVKDANNNLRTNANSQRTDTDECAADVARNKMVKARQDAWKIEGK